MLCATFVPDLALGFAEKMSATVEKVEEFSESDGETAVLACQFLQMLFAKARNSIESMLSEGVEARSFVTQYERTAAELADIATAIEQAVARSRSRPARAMANAFIANYQALGQEIESLRQMLVEALAKAKAIPRPIDWQRVQEVEAAYQQGATKPFQRSSNGLKGE
jgi:hypothetical protein